MRRRMFFLWLMGVTFPLIFMTWNMVRADSEFAGSEACKDCHEAIYSKFLKSVHGKKAVPGNPANREGCESCHGPGAQHVEKGGGRGVAIFAFGKGMSSEEKSSKCLACHDQSKAVAFWNMNRHKFAGNSCTSCHSVHWGVEKLLVASEPFLCFNCHRSIRAQISKQSHHPMNEAFVGRQALTCSSCHDPMSAFGVDPVMSYASSSKSSGTDKMLRADSVNELCFKCHAEKRGPFMWEHVPVMENCLICHVPHGSNHSKLLAQKVPLLCQDCHGTQGTHPTRPNTNLQSFSGSATANKNRFFARSCLNCHTNIHGSNGPRERGEVFTR
jgi:DmsE family decaheme c-type cytochrome